MNNLFNKRILHSEIEKYTFPSDRQLKQKINMLKRWKKALSQSNLDETKEVSLQGDFLNNIFKFILGYISQTSGKSEWTLIQEATTEVGSKSADGLLGFFTTDKDKNLPKVIIELKDARTNLDTKQRSRKEQQSPVEQAFSYSTKFSGIRWVIVSNFKEIRIYNKDKGQGYYHSFTLSDLVEEDNFKEFYFMFSQKTLISKTNESVMDALGEMTHINEETISKEFYRKYKNTRIKLYKHIVRINKGIDKYIALEKAQKILDRTIFVSFCEDLGLLPHSIFRRILDSAEISFNPSDTRVWEQVKGLFASIDKGNASKNINKYNGGLFSEDKKLDSLIIKDKILEGIIKISNYDFESDLNVNILGHIFEQSVSDIEDMKAGLNGEKTDRKKSKRKKEGIYYTPEYITRYIVDKAIGGWLEDQKEELGYYKLKELSEKDIKSVKLIGKRKGSAKIKKHIKFWEDYQDKLRNIKILDPACGSGAFLIQAFDYLFKEGQMVNDELNILKGSQRGLFDLDKHILTNNIFGVDLNEESVQITQLSLWLKTASKEKELTALDRNIKCGNSLIDDPEVAGDKAFNWKREFKEIMEDGGFDVIIGNPPYIKLQNFRKEQENSYKFLLEQYKSTQSGNFDMYIPFIERALDLLKNSCFLAFIAPNVWIYNKYGDSLKNILISNKYLYQFLNFGSYQVFKDATTYTAIQIFKKEQNKVIKYAKVESDNLLQIKYSNIDYNFKTPDSFRLIPREQQQVMDKMDSGSVKLLEATQSISELSERWSSYGAPFFVIHRQYL